MADLIDRQALLAEMRRSGRAAYMIVQEAPAVDAVEVQAIEKWLYRLAMNNVGQPAEDMAAACEIIISRLDGLRRFAKERREENEP